MYDLQRLRESESGPSSPVPVLLHEGQCIVLMPLTHGGAKDMSIEYSRPCRFFIFRTIAASQRLLSLPGNSQVQISHRCVCLLF